MQSAGLHQHPLLTENSNILYLSPSGSAEILPATRKVMIVLTPLQRRDAYCRVRCAECAVYHLVSWPPQLAVLWVCVMELSRFSCAAPLGCPRFTAWKKARLATQQKSTKALHSKNRCVMIIHKSIWWYSEFSNASVIFSYHMSRQSWSCNFRDNQ